MEDAVRLMNTGIAALNGSLQPVNARIFRNSETKLDNSIGNRRLDMQAVRLLGVLWFISLVELQHTLNKYLLFPMNSGSYDNRNVGCVLKLPGLNYPRQPFSQHEEKLSYGKKPVNDDTT